MDKIQGLWFFLFCGKLCFIAKIWKIHSKISEFAWLIVGNAFALELWYVRYRQNREWTKILIGWTKMDKIWTKISNSFFFNFRTWVSNRDWAHFAHHNLQRKILILQMRRIIFFRLLTIRFRRIFRWLWRKFKFSCE